MVSKSPAVDFVAFSLEVNCCLSVLFIQTQLHKFIEIVLFAYVIWFYQDGYRKECGILYTTHTIHTSPGRLEVDIEEEFYKNNDSLCIQYKWKAVEPQSKIIMDLVVTKKITKTFWNAIKSKRTADIFVSKIDQKWVCINPKVEEEQKECSESYWDL